MSSILSFETTTTVDADADVITRRNALVKHFRDAAELPGANIASMGAVLSSSGTLRLVVFSTETGHQVSEFVLAHDSLVVIENYLA